jgi:hypothetical protein
MRAFSWFFGRSFFAFHLHLRSFSQQYGFQSGDVCLGGLKLKIRCVGTGVLSIPPSRLELNEKAALTDSPMPGFPAVRRMSDQEAKKGQDGENRSLIGRI